MNSTSGDNLAASDVPERRSFLTRALAILVGGIVAIFPFAAGSGVLLESAAAPRDRPVTSQPRLPASFASARSTHCRRTASPHLFVVIDRCRRRLDTRAESAGRLRVSQPNGCRRQAASYRLYCNLPAPGLRGRIRRRRRPLRMPLPRKRVCQGRRKAFRPQPARPRSAGRQAGG